MPQKLKARLLIHTIISSKKEKSFLSFYSFLFNVRNGFN